VSETRGDYLTRFESAGVGTKSKQAPISVMLPADMDVIVRSLPNRSEWVRAAIAEKLAREKPAVVVEAIAPAVAPNPTPKKERRSQKLSTTRPPSKSEPDELKPEQLIHNPAGWRGWVDKPLGGDRYQITFENGVTDDYPRHLLRVQED